MAALRTFLVGVAVGLLVWFALFFLNYGVLHDVAASDATGAVAKLRRFLPGEGGRDVIALPMVLVASGLVGLWRRGVGVAGPGAPPPTAVAPAPRQTDEMSDARARTFDQIVAERPPRRSDSETPDAD